MNPQYEHPAANKIMFVNVDTGARRTVRRNSAEHVALMRDRRLSHIPTWVQVFHFSTTEAPA
jgi:hypothetical protein